MKRYEFWNEVRLAEREGQRIGQAVFNVASEMNDDLCGQACENIGDPFFNDALAKSFVEALNLED